MDAGGRVSRLFCFGLGYSAEALAGHLAAKGWEIAGTARDATNIARIKRSGYAAAPFAGTRNDEVSVLLAGATHLLHSIPPGPSGDPVLAAYLDELAALPQLRWAGYLSTVGVYGDTDGAWVDEGTPSAPNNERSRARVKAERAWLAFGERTGVAVQVFRLAGIYGPGRSALDKLRAGTARRIVKAGQAFNRIHVEDIASVLEASIAKPEAGAIYNVVDDEAAAPDAVVTFAAELLGVPPPPAIPFGEAELTPMARSFYGSSRRISNARIKSDLGVTLRYSSYREGLQAILERENESARGHLLDRGGLSCCDEG
jgi:nucleoside-diphosphate-sugar epimerase